MINQLFYFSYHNYSLDMFKLFFTEVLEKKCKKCALPKSYPGIKFYKNECNFCRIGKKPNFSTLWEEVLLKIKTRKNSKYHCILGLSGGKDSAYLAYLLVKKYKLKVLAVTIENGFLSPFAKENISYLIKKLRLSHKYINVSSKFIHKLSKKFKTRPKKLFEDLICGTCYSLQLKELIKIAKKENAPLVIIGTVDIQVPEFLKQPLYKVGKNVFLVSLYHILNCSDTKKIYKIVKKLGLLKHPESTKTNCLLSKLIAWLDINHNGLYKQFLINRRIRIINSNYKLLWRFWYFVYSVAVCLRLVWRKETNQAMLLLGRKFKF